MVFYIIQYYNDLGIENSVNDNYAIGNFILFLCYWRLYSVHQSLVRDKINVVKALRECMQVEIFFI